MIDLTNYIVRKALKMGVSDIIARGVTSKNQQVRFSNNEIDIAKTWYTKAVHIFLGYNKRIVTTTLENVDTIDESLETLVNLAKVSKENPDYAGIAQGPFPYERVQTDPRLKDLTEVSDFVIAAVNKALEHASTTAGVLHLTSEDVFLSTSGGVEAQDELTSIELSIRAFSHDEASGHSVTCSPTLQGFHPEKAGEEAGELARLARTPLQGDEGVYDVVFSPLFFGSVLSYSMEMASAFNVLVGRSMYVDKIGEKVASDQVSIADTPVGMNQYRFDNEGVPTAEHAVIEKGILKTYLHNTSTAAKMHTETTGNAGVVVPYPLNIHMHPGDYTTDELFEEVDHGLYLTNTWYTRFQNLQTGDFSTIPRDAILLVEKGEIAGSLKNIRLSDNMLELYKRIEGVSKEQKLVHWWAEVDYPCLASHVLARKVNITRSTD